MSFAISFATDAIGARLGASVLKGSLKVVGGRSLLGAGGTTAGVGGGFVVEGATQMGTAGALGGVEAGAQELVPQYWEPDESSGTFGQWWRFLEALPVVGTGMKLGETIQCYIQGPAQPKAQDEDP
jgi:hypothetical protein